MANFLRNKQQRGDSGHFQSDEDNVVSIKPQKTTMKSDSISKKSISLEQKYEDEEQKEDLQTQKMDLNTDKTPIDFSQNGTDMQKLLECAKKIESIPEEVRLVLDAIRPIQSHMEMNIQKFLKTVKILDNQFKAIIRMTVNSNGLTENTGHVSLEGGCNSNVNQPDLFLDKVAPEKNQIKSQISLEINNIKGQEFPEVIEENEIKIDEATTLNFRYLRLAIQVICPYIDSSLECLVCMKQKERQVRTLKSYVNDLRIISSKLKTLTEFLPFSILKRENDLFDCDTETDPTWISLRQSIEYVQITPPQQLEQSLKSIHKVVMLGNAMTSKGAERTSEIGQWIQRNLSSLFYICSPSTSERKANIFFSDPDPKTAIQVWNFLDDTFIQHLMKVGLHSIKYCKKIYVPRTGIRFTKQVILDGVSNGDLNSISNIKEIKENNKETAVINASLKKALFKPHPDKIQVRVLCSSPLHSPGKCQQNFKAVVLHIHGGGFVAMGSKSHQNYTRQWANQLQIPLLSVDYGLAPKNPYPEGLDDCFQVYQWILNHIHEYFNIVPEKIILAGDSAGGNLSVAMTLLCIKNNIRVPDGIIALYPVFNLDLSAFTPSYFLALEDLILPHMFLKLTLNAYLSDPQMKPLSGIDPFISPQLASDELLKHFPPIRMQTGTVDPLQDHSFRFLNRLKQLDKDAKLIVYNGMPHGYMSYDFPVGMKEANTCVIDAIRLIRELLGK